MFIQYYTKSMTIALGKPAPDFTLENQEGEKISLASLRGKNVVIYFYPKDSTPGCTQEACDFRDNIARLQSADTVVLGISKDSAKSHTNFRTKYELPFDLLVDEGAKVCDLYGCWKEKSIYGKTFLGVERSTFLIDKEGILRKEWRKVSVKGHVDSVLEAIAAL